MLGQRHVQSFLLFSAITVNFMTKFNAGVAVVAMTDAESTNPDFPVGLKELFMRTLNNICLISIGVRLGRDAALLHSVQLLLGLHINPIPGWMALQALWSQDHNVCFDPWISCAGCPGTLVCFLGWLAGLLCPPDGNGSVPGLRVPLHPCPLG